jgi:AbrB family looped-hinge helix DNA binding protein
MGEVLTVSVKGQITLPFRIRSKLGLKAGDRIIGEYVEGGFVLKKPLDFFSLKGSLSGGKMPDNEEELLTSETGKRMLNRK